MFHIRLPIVPWQTFVINCKANTNVCLAFLRKATWGAAFSFAPRLLVFLSNLHLQGQQPRRRAVPLVTLQGCGVTVRSQPPAQEQKVPKGFLRKGGKESY